MISNLHENSLPKAIYRRLLILTDSWPGERASAGSLLVKCHTGGEGLPFFWCGGPENLVSFNEVFGQDRSLYCLCGTWGVFQSTDENIRALARYYVDEILKVQPQGPYLLGGYCDAGLIIYEIAQLLQAQNYKIGTLILFDRDITFQTKPLKAARRLFRLIENIVKRKNEFQEDPIACITSIFHHKKSQLNARIARFKKRLAATASDKSTEYTPYLLSEYHGEIDLIYIRWGLLGYYQFAFFQHYWDKLVLEKNVALIEGYVHFDPDWMAVARIIQKRLKEMGF